MSQSQLDRDVHAEESMVGCVIGSGRVDEVAQAVRTVAPADMHAPGPRRVWAEFVNLYDQGLVEAGMMRDTIALLETATLDRIGGEQVIYGWADQSPTLSPAEASRVVMSNAYCRRTGAFARELASMVDRRVDAAEILDRLQNAAAEVDVLAAGRRTSMDMTELLTLPPEKQSPWLIHDRLRRGHRVIVIGRKGSGKSYLVSSFAVSAAYGFDPFTHDRLTEPLRVLVVDAENEQSILHERLHKFEKTLRDRILELGIDDPDPGERIRWELASKFDLVRSNNDRRKIERELVQHRPDLLVLGPLYKLGATKKAHESWSESIVPLLEQIDSWRERYGVAVMIEHHAREDESGSSAGASELARWPEHGFIMSKSKTRGRRDLGNFRPSRTPVAWPTGLREDSRWIFNGLAGDRSMSIFDKTPIQEEF